MCQSTVDNNDFYLVLTSILPEVNSETKESTEDVIYFQGAPSCSGKYDTAEAFTEILFLFQVVP